MTPTIKILPHRPVVCHDRPTTLELLVQVQSPPVNRMERPPLNLSLALDRSGSMAGAPLEHAKQAAKLLVDMLKPEDTISLVAFDTYTQVVVPAVKAKKKKKIKAKIDKIDAGSATDLHNGWLEACCLQRVEHNKHAVSRTIVLSDGIANQGLTDTSAICAQVKEWQQRGVGTTTVGLGLHYNEELLSKMAEYGGGNFFHAPRPEELGSFFETEFHSLSMTYGRQVSLGLETFHGVQATRLYNPLPANQDGSLALGDLTLGLEKDVVFQISVPAVQSEQLLCRVHLRYTDQESRRRCLVTEDLHLPTVSQGRLDEFIPHPKVIEKRNLQMTARALKRAHQAIGKGEHDKAKGLLRKTLLSLKELKSTPQLKAQAAEMEDLIAGLERREYASVQKRAMAGSTSISSSSITFASPAISQWLKLPEHERTQERLNELMRDEDLGL